MKSELEPMCLETTESVCVNGRPCQPNKHRSLGAVGIVVPGNVWPHYTKGYSRLQ